MTPPAKQRVAFALGLAAIIAIVVVVRSRGDEKPAKPSTTSTAEPTAAPPPSESGHVAPPPAAQHAGDQNGDAAPIASGKGVDLGMAMLEAKKVQAARAALAAGNAKLALQEIEAYEKIPDRAALRQEAVVVKIEALSKVGRRTDALALAMSTRDDPAYADYKEKIDALLRDAGL
jgi:hypothetical protein